MVSVKKNILFSSILASANYVFPLIVYPYISRVLGVSNIGICNFVDSVISYFILVSMTGILVVGTREIASAKEKGKEELDRVFSNLFIFNALTTIIAVVILAICTLLIPKLYEHSQMMLLGGVKLVFNYLMIEWFFKGLEDFRYITIRTIVIRCVYVLAVFLFVKESSDYVVYYLLTVLTIVINAIVNLSYCGKHVHLSLKKLSFIDIYKPLLILGFYTLVTSMYTSFNVAYLGFTSSSTEVGYYTTATKLHGIIISLFTALTGVMLPRQSALLANGKYDEYKKMLVKTSDVLLTFSIPLIIFCIFEAETIIRIISGDGYDGAILPMQIIMPLILVIGYEQVIVIQGLMPLKKDKAVFRNALIGSGVGITLNLLIVPYLQSVGSAIVWLCSEVAVLLSAQYYITRFVGFKFPIRKFFTQLLYNLPIIIGLVLLHIYVNDRWLSFFLSALWVSVYFLILNLLVKRNDVIYNLFDRAVEKVFRRS